MKRTKADRLARLIVVSVPLGGTLFAGLASQAQLSPGSGTGLTGEYFANASFSGTPVLTRIDRQVSFLWGSNAPASGLPSDQFSIRWSGQLEAPVTGRYTIRPIADDGMRIYLSGRKIVDIATASGQTTAAVQVDLTAGQRYPLQVEYFEKDKTAIAALQWSYPGMAQEVIPTSRLYPQNLAPTVSLTSPTANARFTAPDVVNLAADARDADGSISKVEFFAGTTKLGEATTAPFKFTWGNAASGTYALTAKATDNAGSSTTSAPVSVEVVKPTFADTTAASPGSLLAGEATTITPKITCTSGSLSTGIVDLEIFDAAGVRVAQQAWDGQTWAAGSQRTNSFQWKAPSTPGTYTAKVGVFRSGWGALYYWNDRAATIQVTKPAAQNVPPTVSLNGPSAGASYTAPATIELSGSASDSDGTISKVEFFTGSTKLGEDTAAPYTFSWSGVPAGTYTLTAKATDNAGAFSTSAPVSVAVNPASNTVAYGASGVPTNLRVQGMWDTGTNKPTDILTWDPVDGATSYNIYQYDVLMGKGVTGTNFKVPVNVFYAGLTYAVTSVDADGFESIPSNIVATQGSFNPNQPAPYVPEAPNTPVNLSVTPEWNAGRPRIHLLWYVNCTPNLSSPNFTYTVYRDGIKVAAGLWGLNYYDNNVKPGETHTYTVAGTNVAWTTPRESAPSAPITATALTAAPAPVAKAVTITSVTPNDDSVVVSFSPVPGAVDYRCYQVGKPSSRKYSGGGLRIEMNGLSVTSGADLIVEAVDKLGPFQKHDGFEGPGMMQHDGSKLMETNGQGDPSNVPIVLARSQTFHVNCQERKLTGEQVFFDNFRTSQPFVWAEPPASLLPSANGLVKAFQNDKWLLYNVQGDLDNSQVFVQGSHFMDTFYDGDRPNGSGPLHNNVGSFVMTPRATADISGGKVLHVTFEVDPHMGPRRWCDLFVAGADDPLKVPGKFLDFNQLPTQSGNLFRWEIQDAAHGAQIFSGPNGQLRMVDLTPEYWDFPRRRMNWDSTPLSNGSMQDLDLRHRYDLYLSQTHYRIEEEGVVIKDADFPAGVSLPFNRAAVYFVHQVYHTGVERPDLTVFYKPERYWYNYRPYADERHWDNMGFQVLPGFPPSGSTKALSAASARRSRK